MTWAGLPTLTQAQDAYKGSVGGHLCPHTTQVAALGPEIKFLPHDTPYPGPQAKCYMTHSGAVFLGITPNQITNGYNPATRAVSGQG